MSGKESCVKQSKYSLYMMHDDLLVPSCGETLEEYKCTPLDRPTMIPEKIKTTERTTPGPLESRVHRTRFHRKITGRPVISHAYTRRTRFANFYFDSDEKENHSVFLHANGGASCQWFAFSVALLTKATNRRRRL